MYLVIFDKKGDTGLSGWHYEKLREFEAEWIQESVIKLNKVTEAERLADKLLEFNVEDVRIMIAHDITTEL